MRVLVCGGRDYADNNALRKQLDLQHAAKPISVLIEGGARGADRLAAEWAEDWGVPVMRFPAPWRVAGKAAGPWRNDAMLRFGAPLLVIAFPGGRGTADMVNKAKRRGIDVIEVSQGATND